MKAELNLAPATRIARHVRAAVIPVNSGGTEAYSESGKLLNTISLKPQKIGGQRTENDLRPRHVGAATSCRISADVVASIWVVVEIDGCHSLQAINTAPSPSDIRPTIGSAYPGGAETNALIGIIQRAIRSQTWSQRVQKHGIRQSGLVSWIRTNVLRTAVAACGVSTVVVPSIRIVVQCHTSTIIATLAASDIRPAISPAAASSVEAGGKICKLHHAFRLPPQQEHRRRNNRRPRVQHGLIAHPATACGIGATIIPRIWAEVVVEIKSHRFVIFWDEIVPLIAVIAARSTRHVRPVIIPTAACATKANTLMRPNQCVIRIQAGRARIGQTGLVRIGRINVLRATVAACGVRPVIVASIRIVICCCHSSNRFNRSPLTTPLAGQNWNHRWARPFRKISRLSFQSAAMNWGAPPRRSLVPYTEWSKADWFHCSWSRARNCTGRTQPQFASHTSRAFDRRFATGLVQPCPKYHERRP